MPWAFSLSTNLLCGTLSKALKKVYYIYWGSLIYPHCDIFQKHNTVNTVASEMLDCCKIFNSHLGGIPSTPGDLLSFIVLIFLATIKVTINCAK